MPIFAVIAIGVIGGLIGYMFGKETKKDSKEDKQLEYHSSKASLNTPSLTPPEMPSSEAKKEEVKAEAKAELTHLLEGRTLKDTEGKLFVLRRSTKADCWNLVDATDAKNIAVKDMTYEDIKSAIDSGEFTLT